MFRPRSALALLLIGIAVIVPGASYATPVSPEPTSEPSITATPTPTAPATHRVTMTPPATSTTPLHIRMDGVWQGLPVTIAVLDAANNDIPYAYITTMTTSSTNVWLVRSGDGVQIDAADYQRWQSGRIYLVQVTLGPEPDATTWQRTFKIAPPDKSIPTKPTETPNAGDRKPDNQGGLAKTGW